MPGATALGDLYETKSPSKRGLCFLVGGLVGGTLLVAILSFVFNDWSHLKRWLSGLGIVAIAAAFVFGKHWLLGRVMLGTQQKVDPQSRAEGPGGQS